MKLRITIDGKTFEADVEILETQESAPEYPPYPPVPPALAPTAVPEPLLAASQEDIDENDKECRSPVTGMVMKVNVEPGQITEPNEIVVILESMKMEMEITAPHGGVVKSVMVTPGSAVKVNQLMVEFE